MVPKRVPARFFFFFFFEEFVQATCKMCVQKQSPRISKTLSNSRLRETALPEWRFTVQPCDDGTVATVKRLMEQIRGVTDRLMQIWKRYLPVWQGRSVKGGCPQRCWAAWLLMWRNLQLEPYLKIKNQFQLD